MTYFNFYEPYKNSDEYLRIMDSQVMPCDSVKQITKAQSVLRQYAKGNNVRIEIFDPRHRQTMQKLAPNSDLAACVGICVRDIDYKKTPKYDVIDFFKEENTPFIKRVYKSVQKLITGDGALPIDKFKAETMKKLIKSGKIKA